MRELLITNDPVLLNYVEVLLADFGIASVILDRHISILEGGLAPFPCRLVVAEESWLEAERVMKDAGLSAWVNRDGPV
jgi:Putative prokaryotic signal transducing protein